MDVTPPRGLRLAYWFGAIADGAMVVPLVVPAVAAAMLGLDRFDPGPDYRYAAGVAAGLMAGWTVLLVWGVRQPVERRALLLITAIPVVVAVTAAGVYAVASGFVELRFMVPTFGFQAFGFTLFVTGYLRARAVAARATTEMRNLPVPG